MGGEKAGTRKGMIRIKWDDGERLRWRNLEYVTGWTQIISQRS